jgi:hypothetical protein
MLYLFRKKLHNSHIDTKKVMITDNGFSFRTYSDAFALLVNILRNPKIAHQAAMQRPDKM